ncbi:MAG: hypothetical protein R3B45_15505 [Bdellovibrionota bacterium]
MKVHISIYRPFPLWNNRQINANVLKEKYFVDKGKKRKKTRPNEKSPPDIENHEEDRFFPKNGKHPSIDYPDEIKRPSPKPSNKS